MNPTPRDAAEEPAQPGRGSEPGAQERPRILAERYLLEEPVATGGMATVWRAHDELLARTVAVKILHPHLAADEAFRERFRREAIAAAKLTHPNVVGLFDTGSDGGQVYLVMEFVEGMTLKEVLTDLGTLEPAQAADVGEKIARALACAHDRGLVHRDVKPANILVGQDGTVKVADFGIAKAETAGADLTTPGTVLGTAAYVAPEQVLGESVDGQADQYALGCLLYESLTGRQPFKAGSPVATAALRLEQDPLPLRSLRAGIPKGLDDVVLRAMARRPADRYPTTAHLADALAPYAAAERTAALIGHDVRRPSPVAPLPREVSPDAETLTGIRAPAPSGRTAALPFAGSLPQEYRDPSFLRSEGRWIAPVVGLALLAVALVGAGLITGVIDSDAIPILNARDSDGGAPAGELVLTTDIRSYDPQGDGVENEPQLRNILDGDDASFWRTDLYRNRPDLGGLKEGVGFWVDLGAPRTLRSVTLRTPTPGITYEVRVADEPAPAVDGWRLVGEVAAAPELHELRMPADVTARYVLVWITELQPHEGRFMAAFSGMAVRAVAQ